jgi:hypothetical protein
MIANATTPRARTALEAGGKQPQRPPVDWSRYDRALSMGLDRQPKTLESQALSEEVARRIERWEVQTGVRKYARRNRRSHLVSSVGRVLGDLLAAADVDVQRWTYHSLWKAAFTGRSVTYRDFLSIYKAMQGLGLVAVLPGYYQRTSPFGASGYQATGKATRFRATSQLSALSEEFGIERGEAKRHFIRGLPSFPLVLKAASTRYAGIKHSGRTIRFKHDDRTRRLEAEVHEINKFIDEHDLAGGTHRGYRRIFNCGDQQGFDWNKGGRLYSQGEDSYQRLHKEDRLKMLIDGQPVVEIDVTASFLTILHAKCRRPLDLSRDPYAIEGLPRSIVKAWVTMTLGHDKFHTRWPREISADYLEEHGRKIGAAYPLRKVHQAVTRALPLLAEWPDQPLSCFDLMYIESEAIMGTMLRLMREPASCV